MDKFIAGPGNPAKGIQNIPLVVKELAAKSEPGTKFATLGLCWGAKVSRQLISPSIRPEHVVLI